MIVRWRILLSILVLAFMPLLAQASIHEACSVENPACRRSEDSRFDKATLLPKVPSANVLLVTDGRPFGLGDHREMVSRLSGDAAICAEWLMSAQWRQDILRQNVNEAHFDNCAFEPGAAYVASQVEQAFRYAMEYSKSQKPTERDDHLAEGLLALGRALHALQDFYAHSNFVELMDEREPADRALSSIPRPALWTPTGVTTVLELARTQHLYSGAWPLGQYSCPGKSPVTHGQLAKDSSTTERGKKAPLHRSWGKDLHAVALELARMTSAEFLKTAVPKEFSQRCGSRFGCLVLVDSRGKP